MLAIVLMLLLGVCPCHADRMTLEECIAIGLRDNLEIRQAQEHGITTYEARQAQAELYPVVSLRWAA